MTIHNLAAVFDQKIRPFEGINYGDFSISL